MGVYVGVEAVLERRGGAPERRRFGIGELDADDGFDALESVLPGDDQADGGAVLFGQFVAVDSSCEKGQVVVGFFEGEPFVIGPGIAHGQAGHGLLIHDGNEADIAGAGFGFGELDECAEWKAGPGNGHGPSFDATVAIEPFFEGEFADEVVDVPGLGVFDEAGDFDGPGFPGCGSGRMIMNDLLSPLWLMRWWRGRFVPLLAS